MKLYLEQAWISINFLVQISQTRAITLKWKTHCCLPCKILLVMLFLRNNKSVRAWMTFRSIMVIFFSYKESHRCSYLILFPIRPSPFSADSFLYLQAWNVEKNNFWVLYYEHIVYLAALCMQYR